MAFDVIWYLPFLLLTEPDNACDGLDGVHKLSGSGNTKLVDSDKAELVASNKHLK